MGGKSLCWHQRPIPKLRTSHKALLSLQENPWSHRQEGVGERSQLTQLEAMPSVCWPCCPHSGGEMLGDPPSDPCLVDDLKPQLLALASVAQLLGSSHKAKGQGFNSWSGHVPGLWAGCPLGACERQPTLLSHINVSLPSLSPSRSPLSKDK